MKNFHSILLTLFCLFMAMTSVFGQEENEVIKRIKERPLKTVAFELVHKAPQHPDCTDSKEDPQGRRCLTQTLVKKISEDFNKPLLFATPNGQRRIIITILINERGKIQFSSTNSKDEVFDKEIKRIIETVPQLSPGMHMREPARVRLRLPMTFVVSD
ncbi:hypothetical protein [Spongiivirga citrea]|uniref:TonB C-terminal domain-containing protein n=1 Tax=Spongiivirga citrea TaxID=1481457 RepID=A0A6M0CQ47_9FLAO|nr:hypothetical protein [Spongiivirga citrea]NER18154.1 hypothetical protein [Spongiivirga citrea]